MSAAVRHPSRLYLVALTTKDDQVRGSGYLLNSRVVVTAGHVVEGVPAEDLRVCRLHTLRATTAEVVRIEKDIAVLLTAEDLAAPGELANVALRELESDSHFGDCSALGLPAVMTRVTAGVAPLEAAFRVAPNSADNHGYLSLELDGHPPTGPEPWSGMSGAPVFHAGRWLIGVVMRDSTGWNHSRLEASPISALFEGSPLADALFRVRPSPPVTESDARDAAFLDTYRSETIRRYGHIELFGLGLQGHLADDISIDHAYVSLRAGVPSRRLSSTAEQTRPVEPLIAKNTRLLLRGSPGAGKSTLLEWLAVSMARGSCKGELEPFNDRIPFLLRLRDMYAPRWKRIEGRDGVPPRIGQFLEFSGMASDFAPPDGWIRRMLEQERALLLVDGLDEVLEGHRDGVLRWISDLLREFPALHVIVTGRPEALQHWSPPARLGFVELKLVELDADQRAELIHKWHQAAILGVRSSRLGDEERERRIDRLSAYEISLTRHINASSDLSALAATPLLCAVLCKLHEVHGTRLPRFRQELYARTVDMMLGLRDADREVPEPLPGLDIDQRRAVLSWIAGYLTAEGEREITLTRFDEKVQSRLPSLGREAGAHTPSEIRKALHERSGLLVAPAEDTLRFSHRTFQDYLAATDLVAQRSFGQLAGHAGEEMWDDVLRFAMSLAAAATWTAVGLAIRRVARAEAAQRRFVSDASHELRSPVATVRQHAEVALAHPGRADAGALAATVHDEAVRMQRLVDDLLLLTRADEGAPTALHRPVDLDDLVLEELRRLRSTTGLRIDGTEVGAARVSGDEDALRRLVRHLGENAARYAATRVGFTLADTGDGRVRLVVEDDGPGIPAADRMRVFDRFVRLDESRSRDAGGAGLGLAIVAEVAAAHRGTVTAGTVPDGGARFTVTLRSGE
ncbi:ATP-binding protein [Streptomyces sp. NPDC002685]|uniref:ATP-binding protein n=1 Tax=Streptomyces sp. NPDC002685 TaxID=3154540 RepID=UPI00332FB9A4